MNFRQNLLIPQSGAPGRGLLQQGQNCFYNNFSQYAIISLGPFDFFGALV